MSDIYKFTQHLLNHFTLASYLPSQQELCESLPRGTSLQKHYCTQGLCHGLLLQVRTLQVTVATLQKRGEIFNFFFRPWVCIMKVTMGMSILTSHIKGGRGKEFLLLYCITDRLTSSMISLKHDTGFQSF